MRLIEAEVTEDVQVPALERERAQQKATKQHADLRDFTDGFWAEGDEVYMAQQNLRGTNVYVKRLVRRENVADDEDTMADWIYCEGQQGEVKRQLLLHGRKLGVEDAAEFGRLYGFCIRCGRRLNKEESKRRGIGPVCINKI